MAEEENERVTYTVKITVTLTPHPPQTQPTTVDTNAETVPSNGDEVARATDDVAETVSLNNDDEGAIDDNGDDVVAAEESVVDREEQATVSLAEDEGDRVIYYNRIRRRAIRTSRKMIGETSRGSVSVKKRVTRKRKRIVSSSDSEENDVEAAREIRENVDDDQDRSDEIESEVPKFNERNSKVTLTDIT
ncbi:hypothetical protein QL285_029369 [Trifolium repens]|jgi:hypothetical protein|nr:hypothetical protein QL285_029369 [Trifolium repens]